MGYYSQEHAIIYQITNLVNGDFYIGITRFTPENRWTEHKWNAKNGKITFLYRAIRKYGEENFSIRPIASALDFSNWSAVEREIIADRKPIYNQTNGGEITKGRRVSPEVIEKIRAGNLGKKRTSEQNERNRQQAIIRYADPKIRQAAISRLSEARKLVDKEKHRRIVSNIAKTILQTPQSRAKSAQSRRGRKRSAESIFKMSQKKKKLVECTTLAAIFDSVGDAAEMCGMSISGVSRVCLGQRNSSHGLQFKFIP